jgi:phosphoribosylanthranilate isomerase
MGIRDAIRKATALHQGKPFWNVARVRVKICGITRPEWALAAAEAGADAIGLVFAESPRRVSQFEAARIVAALPPWVTPVGVFVDEPPVRVQSIAASVGLTTVQLHGDETPDAPAKLAPLKVVKAFRIGSQDDVDTALEWNIRAEQSGRYPDMLMADARVPNGPQGGTGQKVDWSLALEMAMYRSGGIILAGGLTPENVGEAVTAVRPWGVDVSSGVEIEPGVKDPEKIRAFVEAVRKAGA